MKLLNALNGILTEAANMSDVSDTITNKNLVTIYYDGKDNGGKGFRTIEPVCLGYSKKGNLVLRAWEVEGSSWSASNDGNFLPGWRLFRLDKIFTYQPTQDKFIVSRPKYNPNGDKSMTRVLINAKFNKDEYIE
jgi:predicted DNA-binding transcriptional regulator YafY